MLLICEAESWFFTHLNLISKKEKLFLNLCVLEFRLILLWLLQISTLDTQFQSFSESSSFIHS